MSRTPPVTLLDGGMGRQLSRMGAPFRLPEWSALALIEAPEFVSRAHAAFIDGGAQIITTNSYGLAPSRIGEARFTSQGLTLADRAGRLARAAAERGPAERGPAEHGPADSSKILEPRSFGTMSGQTASAGTKSK